MKHVIIAIADWCEADEGAYPGNIAKILRAAVADSSGAPPAEPSKPDLSALAARDAEIARLEAENDTLTRERATLIIDAALLRDERNALRAELDERNIENDALRRKVEADRLSAESDHGPAALIARNKVLAETIEQLRVALAEAEADRAKPQIAEVEQSEPITLADAIETGDTHAPADDETDAPEIAPLVDETVAVVIADAIAPTPVKTESVAVGEIERSHRLPITLRHAPRQAFEISPGVTVNLTTSGLKVAAAILAGNCTWREIVATGVASTEGSAMAAVSKLRQEVSKQTGGVWIVRSDNKFWSFGLTHAETPTVPATPPAAEVEVKDFVKESAKIAPPFLLPPDRPANVASPLPEIEPGHIIAVDVKRRVIRAHAGHWTVDGMPLAKALHALRSGQMFGLDHIARQAGWRDADIAKTALGFERERLRRNGVDLYLDKIQARLRTPA